MSGKEAGIYALVDITSNPEFLVDSIDAANTGRVMKIINSENYGLNIHTKLNFLTHLFINRN